MPKSDKKEQQLDSITGVLAMDDVGQCLRLKSSQHEP